MTNDCVLSETFGTKEKTTLLDILLNKKNTLFIYFPLRPPPWHDLCK